MSNPDFPKEAKHISFLSNDVIASIPTSPWQLLRRYRLRQLAGNNQIITNQVENLVKSILPSVEEFELKDTVDKDRLYKVANLTGICALRHVIKADTALSGSMDRPTLPNTFNNNGTRISPNEFIDGWAIIATDTILNAQQTIPNTRQEHNV